LTLHIRLNLNTSKVFFSESHCLHRRRLALVINIYARRKQTSHL